MTKPADQRQKDLADVLVGYRKLEKQLKSAPNALRYVQYRMAMLAVDQAKADPSKAKAAIDALNDFRSTNSAGWEIVPATKTVARLLEDSGDKKGALDAYDDLGRNPDVPSDIRLNTNLLVAHMLIQDGKFDAAEKKLSSVLADTKDEKQKAYVQVYLHPDAGGAGQGDEPGRSAGPDQGRRRRRQAEGDGVQHAGRLLPAGQAARRGVLGLPAGGRAVQPGPRGTRSGAVQSMEAVRLGAAAIRSGRRECLDRLKDKAMDGTEYQARAIKEAEAGTKTP